MFMKKCDYSDYQEIKTLKIEKHDLDCEYNSERKELIEYFKEKQTKNIYCLNKIPRRVNQYIDLKILLNAQLCPKIKLWKQIVEKRKELESEEYFDDFFAIKIYSKAQLIRKNIVYASNGKIKTQLHRVINEIKILQYLYKFNPSKHYIVQLHEVLESDINLINDGKFYLVFDFYPLGPSMIPGSRSINNSKNSKELLEENKLTYIPNPRLKIEENTIKNFVYCAATALLKLHDLGIVHRDVKPDNLLLTDSGDVVLNDFNSSEFLEEGKYVSGTEGTYAFFPPEYCDINVEVNSCNSDNSNFHEMEFGSESQIKKQLGRPADMWALGVTIWCWIYGVLPFQGNSILELFENIVKCKLKFQDVPLLSKQGVEVLKKLLDPNPETRFTAEQVLNSEWMKDHRIWRKEQEKKK